jgi:putative NADH-flavin reductase
MRVLILGSTGRTGRCLVEQAMDQGHAVTAFVRDPTKLPWAADRVRIVRGDVLDSASVDAAMERQEGVLSALGSTRIGSIAVLSDGIRNVIRAMETHGVRRLLVVSAAGAQHESAGFVLGNVFLGFARRTLRNVYRGHARQLEHLMTSQLDWTAVRAVLLTNGPRTGRYRVVREGIPRRGYRIARADLADFMLQELLHGAYLRALPAIAY